MVSLPLFFLMGPSDSETLDDSTVGCRPRKRAPPATQQSHHPLPCQPLGWAQTTQMQLPMRSAEASCLLLILES